MESRSDSGYLKIPETARLHRAAFKRESTEEYQSRARGGAAAADAIIVSLFWCLIAVANDEK